MKIKYNKLDAKNRNKQVILLRKTQKEFYN